MTRRKLLDALLLERNASPPPPPIPVPSPSAEWERHRHKHTLYVLLHACGVPTTEIAQFYGTPWEEVVSAVDDSGSLGRQTDAASFLREAQSNASRPHATEAGHHMLCISHGSNL